MSVGAVQVRLKDDEGAMAFGSLVLVKAAETDEDRELLEDALSLLGYEDPASSPCGSLLSARVIKTIRVPVYTYLSTC